MGKACGLRLCSWAPIGTVVVQQAAFEIGHQFASVFGDKTRPWTSADPRRRHGSGLWMAGYGSSADLDGEASAGTAALRTRSKGWAIGIDHDFGDVLLGAAYGYDHSTFAVPDRQTAGRLLGYHGALYGAYTAGNVYLNGGLSADFYSAMIDRHIDALGVVATLHDRFAPSSVTARIETGVSVNVRKMHMTPFAAIEGSRLRVPAIAESATMGSSSFALNYSAQTVHDARSTLGLQLDHGCAALDGCRLFLRTA